MRRRKLKKWVKVVMILMSVMILTTYYIWYIQDLKTRSNYYDELIGK